VTWKAFRRPTKTTGIIWFLGSQTSVGYLQAKIPGYTAKVQLGFDDFVGILENEISCYYN